MIKLSLQDPKKVRNFWVNQLHYQFKQWELAAEEMERARLGAAAYSNWQQFTQASFEYHRITDITYIMLDSVCSTFERDDAERIVNKATSKLNEKTRQRFYCSKTEKFA